ncbi:siderophore-interacting protein [Sinomonas cellulolyticus]|uniref:Siderophore-interacting protein n=1 Tax=Sinomonas cellulolyticus TaxID=2801916 RepID=A0ABS1K0G9_9MICC|nr:MULTISPECIES: siderophore-interacting protein [Sinomonas]MBL0705025.1 siderophore-interacting protein [Sinomonas cellulolyticus]GHG53826.1 siderophore-interacting protein [Sinomonas sp. KCTC 49339]
MTTPAESAPAARTDSARPARKPRPTLDLVVVRTEQLSPHMVRVVAGGPGFDAFTDNGFTDKYVKISFPTQLPGCAWPDGPVDIAALKEDLPREQWPVTRTYTVRSFDATARELAIDFVVHGDEGLAGPWAAAAQPGDRLVCAGPGGAYSPDPEAEWHLFAGDESAVPAIAAALDALPADARGLALLEVAGPEDVLEVSAPAGVELRWLSRDGFPAGETVVLAEAVAGAEWLPGTPSVFAHGERGAMKELRAVFKERGVPREKLSLSGYWAHGRAEDQFQAEKKLPVGQI